MNVLEIIGQICERRTNHAFFHTSSGEPGILLHSVLRKEYRALAYRQGCAILIIGFPHYFWHLKVNILPLLEKIKIEIFECREKYVLMKSEELLLFAMAPLHLSNYNGSITIMAFSTNYFVWCSSYSRTASVWYNWTYAMYSTSSIFL